MVNINNSTELTNVAENSQGKQEQAISYQRSCIGENYPFHFCADRYSGAGMFSDELSQDWLAKQAVATDTITADDNQV